MWWTSFLITTAYKNIREGFYWPSLFSYVFVRVRACVECQKFIGKENLLPLPLKFVSVEAPFQQWGLDFIGEINPPSTGQHKWILTTIDYFMKWIEAVPSRNSNDTVVIKFLWENIFSIFGCPRKIITGKMIDFCSNHNITLSHSTTYYLQGNGLIESSNKSLIRIIKKLLAKKKQSWDSRLVKAL
jgi:hypothetical protein